MVAALLRDPGDLLVVTGLGAPSYDAAAAGDRPLNFYLWGAMGGAAMVGLGLALAQPSRRVLVLTGDGEMLMGMGSLATIAAAAPAEPRHRRAGQRALRRDRLAAQPYRPDHRPRCGRRRVRLAGHSRRARHGRGGGADAAAAARGAVRGVPDFCRTKSRAICRRAMAPTSPIVSGVRLE